MIEKLGERGLELILFLYEREKEGLPPPGIRELKRELRISSLKLYPVIKTLALLGLVKHQYEGPKHRVVLTDEGREFAKRLKELDNFLKEIAREHLARS